jgi:hypothetical protein
MTAPNRRWFQFSLREVALALTALAFAIGWLQERMRHSGDESMTIGQSMDWLNDRGTEEREVGSQLVGSKWYRYVLRREPISD